MARTDPQVNLRIPVELKDALDAAAIENKRSLTAEIVDRLQDSLRLRDVTDETMLRLQTEERLLRNEMYALRMEAAQLRAEVAFAADAARRFETPLPGEESPAYLEALERFAAADDEYKKKLRDIKHIQEQKSQNELLQAANSAERRKRGLKPVFTEEILNSMTYTGSTKA